IEEHLVARAKEQQLDAMQAARTEAEAERQRQHDLFLAQLRQSEERLRLIVDTSDTGTWEMDPGTGSLVADDCFRSLFGLSIDEPFDLARCLAIIHPDDSDWVAQKVAEALAGEDGGRYHIDYRTVPVPGEEPRWIESRGQAFFAPDGQARRFVGTGIDVTLRKRVDQERERLVEELTRSNQALDQFAHVASHDLRAPLRGLANLATWIEEDLGEVVTDEARERFELMRGRVGHLDRMITGLLDFATAGRTQAEPEAIDSRTLLTQVVELLAPPAHLTLTLGEPMPTFVTERLPLQQVLMNLLGNAIKYTPQADATLRVDATGEGSFVHFTITDNGPGIDPRDHERIWGIFQKLRSRKEVEGSGIGLAVVKKVVESRGGRVWVESTLGHGATYHVLWPRQTGRREGHFSPGLGEGIGPKDDVS
ncbi:MAG: PAS domain-containing sensor histidine kinase, partial [Myxococcales bacterium]